MVRSTTGWQRMAYVTEQSWHASPDTADLNEGEKRRLPYTTTSALASTLHYPMVHIYYNIFA